MATQKAVAELAHALHEKKIINIDTSVRDALTTPSSILNDPDILADWNVIGGSHYFLVTGLEGGAERVTNPTDIERRQPR